MSCSAKIDVDFVFQMEQFIPIIYLLAAIQNLTYNSKFAKKIKSGADQKLFALNSQIVIFSEDSFGYFPIIFISTKPDQASLLISCMLMIPINSYIDQKNIKDRKLARNLSKILKIKMCKIT